VNNRNGMAAGLRNWSSVGRVAGLSAIALLQTYWFLQPVPLAAKAFAAVFVGISITKPDYGLLAFAGLAPLSAVLATVCGGGAGLSGQLLEQMALSAGAGVLLRAGGTDGRTRIGAPALFMAVVAVASAIAMIPAAAAPLGRTLWDGLLLSQLAVRNTALNSPVWPPVFAALVIAECGLLGWAVERTVRREPPLALRLLVFALIGHAGAALWNLLPVVQAAIRTGNTLGELPRLVMSVRLSRQMDWNAGASAFILAGISGLGLMRINRSWLARIGIGSLVGLIAIGLWLTGSRIAIAAGIGGVIALVAWSAATAGRRARLFVVGSAVVVLAVCAWLIVNNPSRRNDPLPDSVAFRGVMLGAGIQMFRQAPVFGIGIGQFYGASTIFIEAYMKKVGGGPRENAHNNFIQVLAEQGVIGLAAMLWWLAAVLAYGARGHTEHPWQMRRALFVGIIACIGTWLTGHPLLVPEFAFVFWLYCGVLTGMAPGATKTRSRSLSWIVAAVLISIPFRAVAIRNGANLEYRGFGLSMWQHDDAQRYQEAGGAFALFLPATGRPVEVPVRRAAGAPDPLLLEVRIRDRVVDRISIEGESWQTVLVVVPDGSRQFELVDFSVPLSGSEGAKPGILLRVGKPVAR